MFFDVFKMSGYVQTIARNFIIRLFFAVCCCCCWFIFKELEKLFLQVVEFFFQTCWIFAKWFDELYRNRAARTEHSYWKIKFCVRGKLKNKKNKTSAVYASLASRWPDKRVLNRAYEWTSMKNTTPFFKLAISPALRA
jgi:hypothetical protein